jgi:hypothetical protein
VTTTTCCARQWGGSSSSDPTGESSALSPRVRKKISTSTSTLLHGAGVPVGTREREQVVGGEHAVAKLEVRREVH